MVLGGGIFTPGSKENAFWSEKLKPQKGAKETILGCCFHFQHIFRD